MISGITLLVADDHPILLKGLIVALKSYNYNVISSCDTGAKALDKIIDLQPTIAILDVEMPYLSGIEVIQKSREKNLPTKFILLTSHKEKGLILQTRELEILGFILKEEPFSEIHKCIQEVTNGRAYYSKAFQEILSNEISPEMEKIKFLSPSERTIIRYVAKGMSSREIGELLSISTRTVEKHRANIITKLGLPSHVDAIVVWAKDHRQLIHSV